MVKNGITITGLVLLVLAVTLMIVGLILYEKNKQERKEQNWYTMLILGLSVVLVVASLILIIVGMVRKSKTKAATATTPYSYAEYRQIDQVPPQMAGFQAYQNFAGLNLTSPTSYPPYLATSNPEPYSSIPGLSGIFY